VFPSFLVNIREIIWTSLSGVPGMVISPLDGLSMALLPSVTVFICNELPMAIWDNWDLSELLGQNYQQCSDQKNSQTDNVLSK